MLFAGKEYFSALSVPMVPIVLCVGLRVHEISPLRVSTSIVFVFVQVMFRQQCLLEFLGVASAICRTQNLTAIFLSH